MEGEVADSFFKPERELTDECFGLRKTAFIPLQKSMSQTNFYFAGHLLQGVLVHGIQE